MPDPSAIDPDEILPPGHSAGPRTAASSGSGQAPRGPQDLRGLLPHYIARWLDDLLYIPGTKIKIGLDPLLALIPGLGDAAVTTAGAAILLTAVRHRAPVGLLVRMAGNMGVNALLNLIPFAGPAASVWFRSNSRNNALLQKHLAGEPPGPPSVQAKVLFAAVLLFALFLMAMSVLVWVMVWKFVAALLGGS